MNVDFMFSRPNALPLRLTAAVFALLLSTGLAHAGGTPSNTTISNIATLNYTVTGVSQPAIGSSSTGNSVGAGTATTFLVDKKINLTVTATDATFISVVPGATARVTTFSVTNTGNDPQDFALTSSQMASGQTLFGGTDNFDTTGCAQYAETAGGAGYQAGSDTTTFINTLAADASQAVYVVCAIPSSQVNNDVSVVALTATAKVAGSSGATAVTQTAGANTAGVDTVFADTAGSDDASRDAAFSARDAYKVVASVITVTKTAALVCDPFNSTTNPKNIPGAVVRWTLTIANGAGAGASAILNTVSDTVDTNTTFDTNLITGAGTCTSAGGTPESAAGLGFRVQSSVGGRALGGSSGYFTSANDADGAELNAGVVSVNFATALPAGGSYVAGELKPGESATAYYNVAVN